MEDKKKPFEERLARLNEIVAKVEGEVLPLDEAMALYEEGKALINGLSKELEEAEKKVAKARAEEEESQ
jgi:exodeoxyribonuclease VII small subunit